MRTEPRVVRRRRWCGSSYIDATESLSALTVFIAPECVAVCDCQCMKGECDVYIFIRWLEVGGVIVHGPGVRFTERLCVAFVRVRARETCQDDRTANWDGTLCTPAVDA